jgi:pSer/pThr/pTyr-binding forkhead associated (FHA) protein
MHASLSCEDGEWVIKDLKSRNGVFVNDEQIETRVVRNNDRIRIGQFDLRFVEIDEHDEKPSMLDTGEGLPLPTSNDIQDPSGSRSSTKGMRSVIEIEPSVPWSSVWSRILKSCWDIFSAAVVVMTPDWTADRNPSAKGAH